MANVKNINSVIAELRKYGKEAEQLIDGITEQSARKIEKDAKQEVNSKASNFGKLGQSINAFKEGKSNWIIRANAPYAAYVEFGTGGLVNVPTELKDIAITWKGKGIRKINLRPRPYMYPALLKGRNEYLETLKKALSRYGNVK